MATTVITGRDLTLTIGAAAYDAQTTSVTLVNSPTIDVYQTLDGKAYKHTDDQWTLNVELLADWVQFHHYSKQCGALLIQHQTQHLQSL